MTDLRKDIPTQDTWDLTHLFRDTESFDKEKDALKKEISVFPERHPETKEEILAYLRRSDEIEQRLEKLYCYANMLHDTDGADALAAGMLQQAESLYVAYSAQTAFFVPELLLRPESFLKEMIADERFKDYEYQLKSLLNRKQHVLSPEEEKLLAEAGDVFSQFDNVFSQLDNVDLPFPKIKDGQGKTVTLSHAKYGAFLSSPNRALRRRTFLAYYKAYKQNIHTITAVYAGSVKKDAFVTKARKYESCLSRALSSEDVSTAVYQNLLSAVGKGLPALHEYMRVRKKELGYKQMHMYDLHVPLVENAELKLSYEEAFRLVKKSLSLLGKEYCDTLQRAKDERWIDVYETKGKRSGAYSCGVYGVHPYVLLNYTPTTRDVFTIAHELGHAMHSFRSDSALPYSKAGYRIFVAEVASTVNELLLLKHLLKKETDVSLRRYLLSYFLDTVRTTMFRQTMFAEFEAFSHGLAERGEPLTKEAFSEAYINLNKKYYGPAVVHDSDIAYEWCRIPHFYTAFYVYKYATGIISAISIVERLTTQGAEAVKDYLRFLSSGGSDSPVELLKIAGVDLTTEKPFNDAIQAFLDALKEFENTKA